MSQLDREQLGWIEDALLIGLAAYGEIERLQDVIERKEACKESVDTELRPLGVDARNDTVSSFATALTVLRMLRQKAESAEPNS